MRRTAFADLIGVSKQQVSKYVADGAVVLDGADVDVHASLAALEGRLDENKRRRALQLVQGVGSTPVARPAGVAPAPSGKARHDEARAEIAELELAKRKGELVEVSEVEARVADAVVALKETMAAGRREDADKICATFGVPAERATALARELAARDDRALGRFATEMAAAAHGVRSQGELAA